MPPVPPVRHHHARYVGPLTYSVQEEVQEALSDTGDRTLRTSMQRRIARLHRRILAALRDERLSLRADTARLKSRESIRQRITMRQREAKDWPLIDIYGVRLVLRDAVSVKRAQEVLTRRWGAPDLPWGIPAVRTGPGVLSIGAFRCVRLTLVISRGKRLAEVQLMTPEEEQIERATRGAYERAKTSYALGGARKQPVSTAHLVDSS